MNKGFTLIEIIIVIAIFGIIIGIVSGTIFLSSKVYFQAERMSEITQNGRVVLDAVSRELRQARKLVTSLPEDDPLSEITFQDGHLETIKENGVAEGGELNVIVLSFNSSSENGFYEDVFIKIDDEVRKIITYDGETKEAVLNFPFTESTAYFGKNYTIDTSYYYIRYFLDEGGIVKREIFTYYFSGDENYYVPYNAVPPEGQSLEKQILESGQIIGEYFENIIFWEEEGINIFVQLKIGEIEIDLLKKVFGRNL